MNKAFRIIVRLCCFAFFFFFCDTDYNSNYKNYTGWNGVWLYHISSHSSGHSDVLEGGEFIAMAH